MESQTISQLMQKKKKNNDSAPKFLDRTYLLPHPRTASHEIPKEKDRKKESCSSAVITANVHASKLTNYGQLTFAILNLPTAANKLARSKVPHCNSGVPRNPLTFLGNHAP